MDKKEVLKRDGKARGTFNINQKPLYLDTDYNIQIIEDNDITPTGLLIIAKLQPTKSKSNTLPEFVFRWDERANTLDVEPLNASKLEIAEFKQGTKIYNGHHPKKLNSKTRQYEVRIIWGSKVLYHGTIGFSLGREVAIFVTLGVKVSISHKLN